MKNNVVELPI